MFKSKDKAIKQLQETLGEMGYDGDVTSTEAREFWETNKGKLPQKYFDKYGDNAIDFIGNNFTTLGQKSVAPSDKKKNNGNENKITQPSQKPKAINYDNLNESYNNPNSSFEDLKKYYQSEKGMSDDDFAKIITNSDWSKGKKAGEWLNEYDAKNGNIKTVSYNGIDNDEENKPSKKTLADLKANETDQQYSDALNDTQFITNVADTQKKDESDYDDMSKIVEKFNEKSSNIDDYYKENLPKTLWDMYKDGDLDGNTGDKEKDKKEAKKRLGYFILNGLGTGLINSSLIARGSAPSAESDLQKIRREKLEGGLERYNQKRNETMNKTIQQLGLNSEMLNKFNLDLDTLKNNKIFEEVSKSLDRKGMERTMKAYKLAGDYLEGLSEEQIRNVGLAIMALNSKDAKDAGIFYLSETLGNEGVNAIKKLFQ